MIKTILKVLGFAAVVLLIGQWNIGSATIAGHLQRLTSHFVVWGTSELKQSKLVAVLSPFAKPPAVDDEEWETETSTGDPDPDGVSSADRESLIRLLQ